MSTPIRVTVWNEYQHELHNEEVGKTYPQGIHGAIAEGLNAVDGISKNDGILMVGSTNHLDRLDPGIAKRPSRFDRKYLFPNPNTEEREKYMKYAR